MKGIISVNIVRHCGRRISKLFYKFPVSTDPIIFTKIELVDNEDVEIMIALYCGNRSDQNAPIHLFAELDGVEPTEDLTVYSEEHEAQEPCMVAPISSDPCDQEVNSDSDPDMDEVPNDIDDEEVNDDRNINASSVRNQILCIVIHNNLGPHMSLIDPDTAHVVEFSEYLKILLVHRLAVNYDPKELFVGQRFERDQRCVVENMMSQQQVNQMEAGHVFVKDVRDTMVAHRRMVRSYIVDPRNRRCDCRRFQTLHYSCAHVVEACAKVSLSVEQFVDDVYTLERMLHVWENEFPVLHDLSTREVI
ncbi:hypothetical protein GOBAR_DD27909 [Gossypium barbadense]|nr:hypothetical protein GOBAR_DD27909 [Gossypium barbadense]